MTTIAPEDFRALRVRLGTQEQAGKILGLSRSSIALRESGQRTILPEEFARLRRLVALHEGSPVMNLDALRDPSQPLPVDLRPLRAALEAIDLDALEALGELEYLLAAAQQAVIRYPPEWVRSDSHACPRTVAGLECRRPGESCVCSTWPAMDHLKLWTREDGTSYALTSEPYELSDEDVAQLVSICDELGLRFRISASSPYYPAGTLLVVITPLQDDDL